MNGGVGGSWFVSDYLGFTKQAIQAQGLGDIVWRVAQESEMSAGQTPARTFTFIDVRSDVIYSTFYASPFLVRNVTPDFCELPGSYHGGAANMAFGDGHAEKSIKWSDPRTNPSLLKNERLGPEHHDPNKICPENADIAWLTKRQFGWSE